MDYLRELLATYGKADGLRMLAPHVFKSTCPGNLEFTEDGALQTHFAAGTSDAALTTSQGYFLDSALAALGHTFASLALCGVAERSGEHVFSVQLLGVARFELTVKAWCEGEGADRTARVEGRNSAGEVVFRGVLGANS